MKYEKINVESLSCLFHSTVINYKSRSLPQISTLILEDITVLNKILTKYRSDKYTFPRLIFDRPNS